MHIMVNVERKSLQKRDLNLPGNNTFPVLGIEVSTSLLLEAIVDIRSKRRKNKKNNESTIMHNLIMIHEALTLLK